jgi:anti-sigma B factor antagonist
MTDTWEVPHLEVSVSYHNGIPVVKAKGDCDLITSRRLTEIVESLVNSGHCRIVFDMRDMTYMDSSGFRVLLEAKKKVADKSGNIVLIGLKSPVERTFKLLNLDDLITRAKTIEEGVQKLQNIHCT